MSSPDITAAEIEAVNQVLQMPYLSIGPRIAEFEERFAAYVGARHAVGVSSGTAGLHLCVIAAGVGEGDLVITTPMTFCSSGHVIEHVGARPILVDVEPDTLNIDPQNLRIRILSHRPASFCAGVHGGQGAEVNSPSLPCSPAPQLRKEWGV